MRSGAPDVVRDDGGQHHGVDVPSDPALVPRQRFHEGLEPRLAGLFEHLAQQFQGGRRHRVAEVDARHVLDPRPSIGGGPAHAGHQAVIELEGGASQAGPVEREVGAVPRGDVAPFGEGGQRLRGGQDPVTERQGLGQRAEELGPVLRRQHGTGAVVRGEDEGRDGQRPRSGHPAPASASTTLATEEKSSRP